jgi:hypothetical protein
MSIQKHSLFETVLARISLGAVPVDGQYWFDPRTAGWPAAGSPEAARRSAAPAPAPASDLEWAPASLPLEQS